MNSVASKITRSESAVYFPSYSTVPNRPQLLPGKYRYRTTPTNNPCGTFPTSRLSRDKSRWSPSTKYASGATVTGGDSIG